MSRRNQERVARKLMELEKGLSGLARARQVAFSDVPVTSVDDAGNLVESDVPVPELFGDIQIDVEQFRQDIADAQDRLDEARDELDTLAESTLPALDGRLDDAEAAVSAAEGRLDAAEGELTDLTTNVLPGLTDALDDAQDELSDHATRMTAAEQAVAAAEGRLDDAEGELTTLTGTTLPALNSRLGSAESAVSAAEGRLTDAEAELSSLDTELGTVSGNIGDLIGRVGTVESDVSDAQGAASAAQAAASDANTAALEAVGIANGKGRVIYQASAPTGANASANNLWIRTSDNKPHTYNGSTWVAVTDKAATDAAAAASTAQTAAQDADAKAQSALSAAQDADAKAVLAQTSADGKSTVTYGASKKASNAAGKEGDTHYVFSGSNLIATQRRTATAWVDAELGHQIIGSVDLGKATVGQLDGQFIAANTVTAEKLTITPGNAFPDPWFQDVPAWTATGVGPVEAPEFPKGNALQIEGAATQRGTYYIHSTARVIPWQPGDTYRVRLKMRVVSGATPDHGGIGIFTRGLIASGSTGTASVTNLMPNGVPESDEPLVYEGTLTIPDTYVGPGTVGVYTRGPYGDGTVYRVGDVQMQLMSGASLVVDGAITGSKIKAGSITASNAVFDTGAIQNADIGNLNASKINAGTLAAARIGAGSIDSTKISSYNLTSLNATIANGVITNAMIANLDASKINAGTLDAARIGANSITSEKLVIGSSENLIPNGAGEAGAAAGWATSLTWDTSDKPSGETGSFRSSEGPTNSYQTTNDWWDVEPGKPYRFEVWLKADKPNSRIYIECRDQDGAHAGVSTSIPGEPYAGGGSYFVSNQLVPTTWTKYAGIWTPNAGSTRVKIGSIYFNHANGTERGAVQSIAGMRLKPMTGATLIEDGAVTTDKVAADAITGNKIKAGSITASHGVFATGAIQNADIGNLNASKINAGTLAAARIGAGTIDTTHLSAGAVTSAKITADELTGLDIVGSKFRLIDDEGSALVSLTPGEANFAVFGTADQNVAISSDGRLSAVEVAAEEITYAGESLNVILNDRPKGLVHDSIYDLTNIGGSSTSKFRSIFATEFELEADRAYLVTNDTSGNLWSNASDEVFADMRALGTQLPGLNGNSNGRFWADRIPASARGNTLNFSKVFYTRADSPDAAFTRLRAGVNMVRAKVWRGGTSGSWSLSVPWGEWGRFSVIDLGSSGDVLSNGTDVSRSEETNDGSGTKPGGSTSVYTKTYNATWSQSYTGAGGQRAAGADTLYQGYVSAWPAGGTQRSLIGFNDSQIRSDISGASIDWIEAYVFFDHWWAGSGGTAGIGTHGNANKPSSWTGSTGILTSSSGWPRGSGRWVRLPSSQHSRFQSGAARGISLMAASTATTYYGYARGVGRSYAPKLRIRYRK